MSGCCRNAKQQQDYKLTTKERPMRDELKVGLSQRLIRVGDRARRVATTPHSTHTGLLNKKRSN